MPRKLTLEERKFILKRYWKTENAQYVIRDWNHYFNTVWLFINFETNLMILAQLPMLRVLVGQVCVCHSVVSRCRECIEAEGLQFEYLS